MATISRKETMVLSCASIVNRRCFSVSLRISSISCMSFRRLALTSLVKADPKRTPDIKSSVISKLVDSIVISPCCIEKGGRPRAPVLDQSGRPRAPVLGPDGRRRALVLGLGGRPRAPVLGPSGRPRAPVLGPCGRRQQVLSSPVEVEIGSVPNAKLAGDDDRIAEQGFELGKLAGACPLF